MSVTDSRGGMRLDPITFEVLRHSFVTIVDEMGLKLFRASFSPPVNQGRDYSIAIFDPEGQLVTAGRWDMPIHYGTFRFTIGEIVRVLGRENVHEGDIVLFNDPYAGGTHNQDVRAVRPIFHEGELIAWLVAMAHWPDVGGPVPGTFNPQAQDAFGEGIRITPVKIYERGVRQDAVIELIMANLRVPDERRGDLHAQVQTLYSGEQRVLQLVEKHGVATIHDAFADCWDYAERMLLAQTSQLPNGTYEWADQIDQDTVHPDRPPVHVRLRLTIQDGRLSFDFTDSDPSPMGPVGSGLPATWSGVLLSVLNLFPGVPMNAGVQRLVDVRTRAGTVVHVEHPTPVSGMAAGCLEKVISCTVGAVGLADPSRRTGCMFNLINLTMGGWDERLRREYVMYLWTPGGFGGSPFGELPLPSMMIYGPGVRLQPAEVLERFYPILVEEFALWPGSAGAGQVPGGWGTIGVFRLTHGNARVGIMADRKDFPIWGVDGGLPGAPQDLLIEAGTERERVIGMFAANVPLAAGEAMHLYTGGGGGYGDPLERDPELVLFDVSEELLTVEQARELYGVVIDPVDPYLFHYELDAAATEAERAARHG
ncbi:MAG: hydantoinase B/oxoprolinase family protein [Thermoleophilia bacterium]